MEEKTLEQALGELGKELQDKLDGELAKHKAGKDYRTALTALYGEASMLMSFGTELTDGELYDAAVLIGVAAYDMQASAAAFTGKTKPPKQVDTKALAGDVREMFKPAEGLDDLGYEAGFRVAVKMIADYLEAR